MLSQIHNINALIEVVENYSELLSAVTEEEKKYIVYSYLLKRVVPDNRYESRIKHWLFTFSQIKWFSFPIIVYVAMSVITISLILVSKKTFLYVMLTVFVILLVNAALMMIKEIRKIRGEKQVNQAKFLRMQREARENLKLITYLLRIASKEILKSIEQDFENENKQLQSRANFLSKLIPFLTIIIIVLFLNVNIDPKTLNDNSFVYNIFKGSAGLYTFFVLILNLYNEFLLKSQYDINNRCLYLLKSAQI